VLQFLKIASSLEVELEATGNDSPARSAGSLTRSQLAVSACECLNAKLRSDLLGGGTGASAPPVLVFIHLLAFLSLKRD